MFSARIWVFYQKTISQIIEISVNAEKNSVISRYNASLDPSSDLIERVPHALEGIFQLGWVAIADGLVSTGEEKKEKPDSQR